jgi:hypothetical protein
MRCRNASRMHTLFQWPIQTTSASPTPSLPATNFATYSPFSSTAQAAQGNMFSSTKPHENRPQITHFTPLTSRQDPLERTGNELPTARSSGQNACSEYTKGQSPAAGIQNPKLFPPPTQMSASSSKHPKLLNVSATSTYSQNTQQNQPLPRHSAPSKPFNPTHFSNPVGQAFRPVMKSSTTPFNRPTHPHRAPTSRQLHSPRPPETMTPLDNIH